jgi:SEC-C motif domain protein
MKAGLCLCHSGAKYKQCCQPYHLATANPEHPEALMRSRYSAFALGEARYLQETLAEEHPDRQVSPQVFTRAILDGKVARKYLALTIENSRAPAGGDPNPEGAEGQVLFHARIFERGKDCSFRELSTFVVEGGRWRYRSGHILRGDEVPE